MDTDEVFGIIAAQQEFSLPGTGGSLAARYAEYLLAKEKVIDAGEGKDWEVVE